MLFSSLEFLFLYLPITLIIYFFSPPRWRNGILLAVSLVFYGWGEPVYLFLMIATVIIDYLFGLVVGAWRTERRGRWALIGAVAVNLGILGFFKYYDFLVMNLAKIPLFEGLRPLGIELPLGISFYTFQALSYVVDVYRGDAVRQKDPICFGAYVALFPQLIAGPIVRYRDIDDQLSSRRHSVALAASGARTFICGLCKKVLIANTAGELWNLAVSVPNAERTVLGAWMGLFWFAIQIYFDFSGYSDMAIGLGKIFGFRFFENFDYPYTSLSITEFWRRWHISLSSWFREYVYIPLGGNRKGRGRTYLNLLAVWLLTGFWHGADWNFIFWGLYYFLLLTTEKAFLGKYLNKLPKLLRRIYVMTAVLFGWLLFVSEKGSVGSTYLATMLGGGAGAVSGGDLYELLRNSLFAVIAVLGATPIPKKLYVKLYRRFSATKYITVPTAVMLLIMCTAFLATSSYNPFLYWNF